MRIFDSLLRMRDRPHPTFELNRCINEKQNRRICTLCRDGCPRQPPGKGADIAWDACADCDICVAQCPAGAFAPSKANRERVARLAASPKPVVTIACRFGESAADWRCHSLAALSWEVVACLALDKSIRVERRQCAGCPDECCRKAFSAMAAQVEAFLGKALFQARFNAVCGEAALETLRLSRREWFSRLGKAAQTAVPAWDEEPEAQAGATYRRQLLQTLRRRVEESGPGCSYGWPTLAFNANCWGCGICARVCPHKAITIREADSGGYMEHIPGKCTGCGLCETVCLDQGVAYGHVAQVSDAMQPISTKLTGENCQKCGRPLKPGSGHWCFACMAARSGTLSPFTTPVM